MIIIIIVKLRLFDTAEKERQIDMLRRKEQEKNNDDDRTPTDVRGTAEAVRVMQALRTPSSAIPAGPAGTGAAWGRGHHYCHVSMIHDPLVSYGWA